MRIKSLSSFALFIFLLIHLDVIKTKSEELISINLIKRICIMKVNSKFYNAGIEKPSGLEKYTCDCFFKEVKSGLSLEKSSKICIENALKEFNF